MDGLDYRPNQAEPQIAYGLGTLVIGQIVLLACMCSDQGLSFSVVRFVFSEMNNRMSEMKIAGC
jgi:hypothetical protein